MEFGVVLQWLLAMAVLTALGAPIAAVLFRSLPRQGAGFALPTALVPLVVAVFWIGQWTFGVHAVLVAVAILAVGAVLAYRDGARPDWRAVAGAFVVFAIGFAIMVVFRASAPAITPAGGEQYLHFGLVNALERAPHLPPEDFWFAGEPLKYYYGTQLQATSWSMLSGTPVRYGFNLAIATFYGVLFVVAYGLVGAIVGARGYSRRLGGSLGALFVAIAGPTTTPIRFITPYLPDGIQEPVSQAAFGFYVERFGGTMSEAIANLANPLDWSWWYTRYVVPGTIQEVPLYSFVKGELHGHTHSTGYVLFAGALAYAYYRTPREAKVRRVAIVFGGLGAVAGVFGFMNTWSLPTAGGLAVLTVAAADPHPATLLPESIAARLQPWDDADRAGEVDRRDDAGIATDRLLHESWRLVLAGIAGAVVILIGVVVASPFLVFGHVPTNDGLGILPATARSALGPFLVIYAGILAVAATYVLVGAWPRLRRFEWTSLGIGVLGLLAAVLFVWLGLNFAVLAVTGPILLGAWLLVRTDRDDFALVLLVAGIGLWLSYEVVHAQLPAIDQLRWNTAMKVSVQGWTLAAAGAGAAVAVVLSRTRDRLAGRWRDASDPDGSTTTEPTDNGATGHLPVTSLSLASAVLVLALLVTLVFPTMVFATEVGDQVAAESWEPTLDGFDDLEQWFPDQAAAIHWLGDRPGTPTIVEATGPSYRQTSPASVFTGLPTVVGWDHEAEYRTPDAYEARVQDVEEIYTADWAVAADHLARYDVEYVYVSENERERYGDELRSFDRPALSLAFEQGSVTIYAVDHSQL